MALKFIVWGLKIWGPHDLSVVERKSRMYSEQMDVT